MPHWDLTRNRSPQPTPTLRDLAMVLFRRRRVFFCVAGLLIAATILYAIFGTKYQASMKVLVRSGRADAPVSAGQNAPLDLTRVEITEEELNSEVELLRGHDVMLKVAEETGIGGRDWLEFVRPGEGRVDERLERAARNLGNSIKVAPIKKTNLILISYAARDPQVVRKVLQSLAGAYFAKHMVVHRPGGELNFFEAQIGESRRELEQSKQRLLRFTNLHGVMAAGLQRDLAVQKMAEVDASERQTGIEIAETQERVSRLESLVATLPERTTTQVRRAENPELMKTLKSSLLELELKRIQLLTKFEPNHRLVQEVEQQIAQTRSSIETEEKAPVEDETTDKNVHFEWARMELEKARLQLQSLEAREKAIIRQQGSYRTIAENLAEAAVEQEDLAGTEKAALENYLLYLKKQQAARMEDALDERGIVNVALAEQPAVPVLPVWPASMVVAIGLVVAAGAGTGAAFAADYLDPAFVDPDDVMNCLHAPVLASLPGPNRRLLG